MITLTPIKKRAWHSLLTPRHGYYANRIWFQRGYKPVVMTISPAVAIVFNKI